MSVADLARRAGGDYSTWWRRCRGLKAWRLPEVLRVAEVLGVPVGVLLPPVGVCCGRG